MRFAVNVSHLTDAMMSFFSFQVVKQDEEFKVYKDKYGEEHIAKKASPFVYVDNEFDADAMRSDIVVRFEDDE